jgi:hypothetical protein
MPRFQGPKVSSFLCFALLLGGGACGLRTTLDSTPDPTLSTATDTSTTTNKTDAAVQGSTLADAGTNTGGDVPPVGVEPQRVPDAASADERSATASDVAAIGTTGRDGPGLTADFGSFGGTGRDAIGARADLGGTVGRDAGQTTRDAGTRVGADARTTTRADSGIFTQPGRDGGLFATDARSGFTQSADGGAAQAGADARRTRNAGGATAQ